MQNLTEVSPLMEVRNPSLHGGSTWLAAQYMAAKHAQAEDPSGGPLQDPQVGGSTRPPGIQSESARTTSKSADDDKYLTRQSFDRAAGTDRLVGTKRDRTASAAAETERENCRERLGKLATRTTRTVTRKERSGKGQKIPTKTTSRPDDSAARSTRTAIHTATRIATQTAAPTVAPGVTSERAHHSPSLEHPHRTTERKRRQQPSGDDDDRHRPKSRFRTNNSTTERPNLLTDASGGRPPRQLQTHGI